ERNAGFSGLLAHTHEMDELNVSIDGGRVEMLRGEGVSGNYFDVLGVKPYIGRTFSLLDERPPGNFVAVLSYNGWLRRFAGDPGVVGKKILIQSHPFTIIGVTPPGFFGVQLEEAPAVRILLNVAPTLWPPPKDGRG